MTQADSIKQLAKEIAPRTYVGVMVSSTFRELKNHRDALITALNTQQFKPVAMEFDTAKPVGDVIDSSLEMVKSSSAYIGVISHKYGQIPKSRKRNPHDLSLTELEFDEARRLERPILIFIMGDQHDVKPADVEKDPVKAKKLAAFREKAKRLDDSSGLARVYSVFESLQEFERSVIHSIANLRRLLDDQNNTPLAESSRLETPDSHGALETVPKPPTLYASPPYFGSHKFVGRLEQLQTLSEWASHADPHPLFLYEAIGGAGKSILSWEWATKHATAVRSDWAGIFWYSFYEKKGTMVDFCRRALAYITGQPRETFSERSTSDLGESLIQHLRARPWLFILDGLERILVSYHRFDAAQIPDDEAGTSDSIVSRDPCGAINTEDEDLLARFAVVSPSKILVTSRLVPRVLLNRSRQPIPGVLREYLPGLRPADAEQLIRSCGVAGNPQRIQDYLKTNCDCHPLVIGVLAGLITDYLPSRGNFDEWVSDPRGGGKLDLAKLDLVQKRNHILSCALLALPESGRKLLATLALLSDPVDAATLYALNPELPITEQVAKPKPPEWWKISADERGNVREEYQKKKKRYENYRQYLAHRDEWIETANLELPKTVRDLERRGLLQYDQVTLRYDLHPVVRGCAASGLRDDEIKRHGKRVLDHFSQLPQNPYTQAESLDDFDNAFHIVKALFQMGELEKARDFLLGNPFLSVLSRKFEAHNEILTLLKPFFPESWSVIPGLLRTRGGSRLFRRAAVSLRRINALEESYVLAECGLKIVLGKHDPTLSSQLRDLSSTAGELNRLALEDRLLDLAEQVVRYRSGGKFSLLLARFRQLTILGDFRTAREVWDTLNEYKMSPLEHAVAAHHYAVHRFTQNMLSEATLKEAEELNRAAQSALGIRNLIALRGFWRAQKEDWESARIALQQAVTLAYKVNKVDRRAEIKLATADHHLGLLSNGNQLAEAFARNVQPWCLRHLAELWLALGNYPEARRYALRAYEWAWADGPPYVRRKELERTRKFLSLLGEKPPTLKAYDPTSAIKLDWEDDLIRTIPELSAVKTRK